MIRDDAQKVSTLLTERLAPNASGVVAEVQAISHRPEFSAPGGARPTFVRYKICIRDEARVARLDIDQAQSLLDDLDGSWGPDRLFQELAQRGLAVEEPGDH